MSLAFKKLDRSRVNTDRCSAIDHELFCLRFDNIGHRCPPIGRIVVVLGSILGTFEYMILHRIEYNIKTQTRTNTKIEVRAIKPENLEDDK